MQIVGQQQQQLECWDLLKHHAQLKLQQHQNDVPAGAADWGSLLMRFRKLREGLTASGAPPQLKREVYEASADVCAAAGDLAELLKCLQQLCNSIYPALAQQRAQRQQQQQQQQQQQEHQASQPPAQPPAQPAAQPAAAHRPPAQQARRVHSAWSDDDGSSSSSSSEGGQRGSCTHSTASDNQLSRHAEVAAALLLYFVCVPRRPVVQEINKQLNANKPLGGSTAQQTLLIHNPVYQQAVLDTAAALRCSYCRFLGSFYRQPQPPLLVRAVMRHHVERLRLQAVRKLGVAYRMLPTAALQRWMWLHKEHSSSSSSNSQEEFQQVVGLLQRAATECGSKAAGIAAAQCVEQGSLPATLQFRAQQS